MGRLSDIHHGQRRPREPWGGDYGQTFLLRYTEPAMCSSWELTRFRVGASRYHDDTGVEYYIVGAGAVRTLWKHRHGLHWL